MLTFYSTLAPQDYTTVSTVLTFSVGSDRQCVNITVENDGELENEEQFTVTLTTADSSVSLNPDAADVLIDDSDCEFTSPHAVMRHN